ncbi:acyltransferase domain-containing protein [Candidatus Saccharibacteria bacterium]|nr:acyltransferase domain-containing protein [Candidatus Saccharibacteria bacterium]
MIVKESQAAVFPGQGVQKYLPEMTRLLLETDPGAEATFAESRRYLEGLDVLKAILEGDPEKLDEPTTLQPAVAVSNVAALESLKRIGFRPDVVAGHSLGEFPSLYAAGSITLETMCLLVKARALFMKEADGGMAAFFRISRYRANQLAREYGLDVAAHNVLEKNKENIVLSGSKAALTKAKNAARAIDLNIPYAAHSRKMLIARQKMALFARHVPIYEPSISIIANGTGDYFRSIREIRRDISHQLTKTVQWDRGIRRMEKDGVTIIYEVGAGSVLTGMNQAIVNGRIESVPFDPSLQSYDFTE